MHRLAGPGCARRLSFSARCNTPFGLPAPLATTKVLKLMSFDQVLEHVKASGGHATFELRTLRDAAGCERIRDTAIKSIVERLEQRDCRMWPEEPTRRERESVIVYQNGSVFDRLLAAFENFDAASLRLLSDAAVAMQQPSNSSKSA